MKKRIIQFILSILFVFIVNQVYATNDYWSWLQNNSDTWTSIIDVLNEKKDELENKINNKTEEDIKIENSQWNINDIEKSTEVYTDIWNWLKNDIEIIQNTIKNNNVLQEELTKEIKNSSDLKVQLDKLNVENSELKKKILEKEKVLKVVNNQILNLKEEKVKAEILLTQNIEYKNQLDKKNYEELYKKLQKVWLITTLFLLFFILKYPIKRYKPEFLRKHKKTINYLYLTISVLFIIFIVWAFFYIKPEYSFIIILVSWYLIYINSDLIGAIINSLVIWNKYKTWDKIIYKDKIYIIKKINPFFTICYIVDDFWMKLNKTIHILNKFFIQNEVSVYKWADMWFIKTEMIFPFKNKDVNLISTLKYIELNIIQKFSRGFYYDANERKEKLSYILDFYYDISKNKYFIKVIIEDSKSNIDLIKEKIYLYINDFKNENTIIN